MTQDRTETARPLFADMDDDDDEATGTMPLSEPGKAAGVDPLIAIRVALFDSNIGIFTFQPSEFGKVLFVLALAGLVADRARGITRTGTVLRIIGFGLAPIFLVFWVIVVARGHGPQIVVRVPGGTGWPSSRRVTRPRTSPPPI